MTLKWRGTGAAGRALPLHYYHQTRERTDRPKTFTWPKPLVYGIHHLALEALYFYTDRLYQTISLNSVEPGLRVETAISFQLSFVGRALRILVSFVHARFYGCITIFIVFQLYMIHNNKQRVQSDNNPQIGNLPQV